MRSLAFAVAFYGGSVFHVLAGLVASLVAPPLVYPICDAWSRYQRICLRWLAGITVEESGERPAGPALYAFKHESFFEAIDLATSLDRPSGFAKEELFRIPGWGRVAASYGAIPVVRSDGARALRGMVVAARRQAGKGRPIAIFPEGTRVAHGGRPRLQAGFAALYKALGLPVVPVATDSGRIYATFWKRPGLIRLHFGEAIEPGLPRAEIERRVHEAINVLNRPVARPGT